ncbi:hypothetical protein MTBLM5_80026 [Magnetospirillum sp. LM-5]|nr:hypothetical protein MTBLM5_80026 [Magnetospirillum sp. LM-5]
MVRGSVARAALLSVRNAVVEELCAEVDDKARGARDVAAGGGPGAGAAFDRRRHLVPGVDGGLRFRHVNGGRIRPGRRTAYHPRPLPMGFARHPAAGGRRP